jgi:hypothetical protein
MNDRISVPVTESRLPVGSSAKMICGARRQRPGHGDALLLTAGELARTVLHAVAESDGADHVVDPLLVARIAAEHHRQADVLLGRERRDEVEGLEDEAHLGAAQFGERLVVE